MRNMSRMIGFISTKWSLFTEATHANKDKPRARRQARAIEHREVSHEIAEWLEASGERHQWLEEPAFDPWAAESAYESHPDFSEGGRCSVCYTDQVDAFVYTVRCDPDREPVTYTSESRSSFETDPYAYERSLDDLRGQTRVAEECDRCGKRISGVSPDPEEAESRAKNNMRNHQGGRKCATRAYAQKQEAQR